MLRKLVVIIPALVLFVIALAFGAQNSQILEVDFFVAKQSINLATLMALFIGAGFVFGVLCMLMSRWRLQLRVRKLRKQLQQLKQRQEP